MVASAVQDAAAQHAGQDAEQAAGAAPEEEPLERLEAQICSLAARLASATYQWLRLVAEFDLRKGWTGWGIKSCAHWLAWSCSVSPPAAREYLRVARILDRLPLVSAAFAAGRLSYSKVKAITRIADLLPEQTLLEQALAHTAAQLDRVVRAFRKTDSADPDRPPQRSARWFYDDEDGTFVLTARLPAAEGAVLLAALQMAEQTLEPGSTAPDALVALADIALAAGPVDSSGDDRHMVILHVDADATAEPTPGADQGRCHLQDGPGLNRSDAERLMCDAAVVAAVTASLGPDGTGEPLRLGRKTRKISPALRRALRIRDDGCQHPGCHRRRFLEAHHVVHWKDGGRTDLGNLVLLCRFHHMQVHDHHVTIAPTPDGGRGWTFRRPDGVVVPAVPDLVTDPAVPLPAPDHEAAIDRYGQGEGSSLAESVGVWCRAADGATAVVDPPDATPSGQAFEEPAEPPGPSDIEMVLAATDWEQFATFEDVMAFCRATLYGTPVPG